MSFRAALRELAGAAEAEFAEEVWHIPTVRQPNMGPIEDPNRPRYLLRAIFDRNAAGHRRTEAEVAIHHKGQHNLTVVLPQPVLTIARDALRYPVTQGDEFLIVADDETYRALNAERAMANMVRVPLEQLGRPSAKS